MSFEDLKNLFIQYYDESKIKYFNNVCTHQSEEHYYNPTYHGLIELGVIPHYLTEDVLSGMFEIVHTYRDNIRHDIIFKGIRW